MEFWKKVKKQNMPLPVLNDSQGETQAERDLLKALYILHIDVDFLAAADAGNVEVLEKLIRNGADIQQKDYLGRNALHLAVCSGSEEAVILLINAGVKTCIKDHLGGSPLSLCLMRRPSSRIAQLLFQHGAKIMPRASPTDTGLFLQFVMMCKPTAEEAKILKMLVDKGAQINDPGAPGGRQALHFAAMSNNCNLIRLLKDLGADLYLKNHRNQTAGDVALIFKCTEAYDLLTEMEEEGSIDEEMSFEMSKETEASTASTAPTSTASTAPTASTTSTEPTSTATTAPTPAASTAPTPTETECCNIGSHNL